VKEETDQHGESSWEGYRSEKGGTPTNGWSSRLKSASSSFERFKSAMEVSTSRKPDMTRYLSMRSHHIASVGSREGSSPISMELSRISKQAFSCGEPRPYILTYLVDLLLREVLVVGGGGHDGHGKPDRRFIKTAPQHMPTRFPVVELA
jgi:hypothetical protein